MSAAPSSGRARAGSNSAVAAIPSHVIDSGRRASTPASLTGTRSGTPGATGLAAGAMDPMTTSSASSSQLGGVPAGNASRADQIVYRFYLKTVGVLVDGRVTHFGPIKGERKKDRWFNLIIPDTEVHKADLSVYRAVSAFPPLPEPPETGASTATIPPLLIAFILDTNDIPSGQTLMWNRGAARVALDPGLVRPAMGPRRPGIVLEQWTFRVSDVAPTPVSTGSDMAPPTAYRLGITHFRSLYQMIRLLPAYRLFRRLRRTNTGLRLGIKLWGPEGYDNTPEGLAEAWGVMERDLVGIDEPLERMIPGAGSEIDGVAPCEAYNFAPLELFGNTYELGVVYRPNIDFEVEDMESVLSERFVVDMEEDWFSAAAARDRMAAAAAQASTTASTGTTRPSSSTAGQPEATPPRPAGTSPLARQVMNRTPSSSTPVQPSSLGAGKWGAMAQGLPFAVGSHMEGTPPSPSATSHVTTPSYIPNRRLSAHSLQPFRSISASPSTSMMRGVPGSSGSPAGFPGTPGGSVPPQAARAIPGSSLGRTSSFLSASGRSFSHAQMANILGASSSPPASSPPGPSPFAPSFSFSKQAVNRPPFMAHSSSSPFVPSSAEEISGLPGSPQLVKRYSSSLSQRRLTSSSGSPEMGAVGMVRRTSGRESGLRHSIDEPRPDAPDNDDVHAFLRALDSWTPPPSLVPQGSPRATITGSAGPAVTTTAPTPRYNSETSSPSIGGPSGGQSPHNASLTSAAGPTRAPLTRAHVDDMLKRMAGSFTGGGPGIDTPPSLRSTGSGSRLSSHMASPAERGPGLLSASRPHLQHPSLHSSPRPPTRPMSTAASPVPRVPTPASAASAATGSSPHTLAGSPLRPGGPGSIPRTSGSVPRPATLAPPAPLAAVSGAARSLPHASTGLDPPQRLAGAATTNVLSPQTTGGTDRSSARRRGPVLVRGGFGAPIGTGGRSATSTTSSSPSHSPVRDLARHRSSVQGGVEPRDRSVSGIRERPDDDVLVGPGGVPRRSATLGGLPPMSGITGLSGFGLPSGGSAYGRRVGRTAPSSLGADGGEEEERNGRRGPVASEGSRSPRLSPDEVEEVQSLMSRMAITREQS